ARPVVRIMERVHPVATSEVGMSENGGVAPHTVEQLRQRLDPFYRAVEGVIIGQRRLLDRLLIGLLTDGHILLEGVPGLAKTLAVRTVARALDLAFKRVQ